MTEKRRKEIKDKYRRTHKAEISVWSKAYYKRNKQAYYKRHLVHRYGLAFVDFEKMRTAQKGKCAICKTETKRLCVDHDHKTGKIRGLLCVPCNVLLGRFERYGKQTIKYLDKYDKT